MAKEEATSFARDGVNYTYTVTNVDANTRILEGTASPGNPFRLVVSGNRVSGTANGIPVSFNVKEAKTATAKNVTVASR
jgi:hypothetical protein